MKPETIAQNLMDISKDYINGHLELEVYRPLCGALVFSLMGFTPEQAKSILDKAKLEIWLDTMEELNREKQKKENEKS